MSDSHEFLVKQEEWERQQSANNHFDSHSHNRSNRTDEISLSSSSSHNQTVQNQSGNPSQASRANQIQSNQSSYSFQTSQSTISHPRESSSSGNNNDLLDLDDLDGAREEDSQTVNQFIKKTYDMVNDASTSEIVAWDDNGDSFIVKKEFEFSSIVLPRYFRHRNFSSFVRQLNFYSFHKRSHAGKYTKFQHPYFRRGQPNMLHMIKRKSTEATANFKDNIANLSAVVTDLKRQYDEIFTIQQHILCIFERYMKAYPLPLKDLHSINQSITKSAFPIALAKELPLIGPATIVTGSPVDERSAKRQRVGDDLSASSGSPPVQLAKIATVDNSLNPFSSVVHPAVIPTFSTSASLSVPPPLPPVLDPSLYPAIDAASLSALNSSIALAATQQQLAGQSVAQLLTQSVNAINPSVNPSLNPSLASLAASIYSLIDQQQPFPHTNAQSQAQLSSATLDFLSRSLNQSANQSSHLTNPELLRLLNHAAPSNQTNRLDAIRAETSNEIDEDVFEVDDMTGSSQRLNNQSSNMQNRRDGYLPSMNQSNAGVEADGFYNGNYGRSMNQGFSHPVNQTMNQQYPFSSVRTKTQMVDPFFTQPSGAPLGYPANHIVNPLHVHNTCAPSTSMAASTSSFDQSINPSSVHSLSNQPITQSVHPSLQAALNQYQTMGKFDQSFHPPLNHTMNMSMDSMMPYKNHSAGQPITHLTGHSNGQDATSQAIDLASRLQMIANVTRQLQSLQSNGQPANMSLNPPVPGMPLALYPPSSQPLMPSHQSVRSLSRDPSPNLSALYDDQPMNQTILHSMAPRDYLNHSQSLMLDQSMNRLPFSPSMASVFPDLPPPLPKSRR